MGPRHPRGDDFVEEVRSAPDRQPLEWRVLDRQANHADWAVIHSGESMGTVGSPCT